MNLFNVPLKILVCLLFADFFFVSAVASSWDLFAISVEITYITLWTDVKSAKMAVMFRLLVFLSD